MDTITAQLDTITAQVQTVSDALTIGLPLLVFFACAALVFSWGVRRV